MCVEMFGRKQNCALVAQINVDAGFILQLMREFEIHARAGGGERLQYGWSLDAALNQHPGGGMRGFLSGFAALYHQNLRPTLTQRDRKRQPDDASANDDDVPTLHLGIVKELRRFLRVACGGYLSSSLADGIDSSVSATDEK
jgi:hypothetical protein